MITEEMRKYRNNIRYKVDTLVILFNDGSTSTVEPGMITSIYIEKDSHKYADICARCTYIQETRQKK